MGGWVGRGSPDPAAASVVRARRRSGPFWSVAYAYLVIMLGTTLPSPLYGLYEDRFGFDAAMLTIIFAAYAGGVLIRSSTTPAYLTRIR
jgi:hypothetical protein